MRRQDEDLPDGWIRTPLPPIRRECEPDNSWFARTGEPAMQRDVLPKPTEDAPPTQQLAVGILVGGLLFLGVVSLLGLFLVM